MASKRPKLGLAIAGLIINILVLPGLGTIIAGEKKTGMIQLVLFLIGIPLVFLLAGIPLMIAMWIWALVSSINILQRIK